jgi:diguanylate cyclase (GGDEF)-like protein
MDRRVVAGLAAGLGGLVAGVVAGVGQWPPLAVVAGALAFAAAFAVLRVGEVVHTQAAELRRAREEIGALESEVTTLRDAADAGREAIRVAGTFAEMVAMRNLELARRAGGGLLDEATGLLDGRYFQPALASRVAAARRLLRPVSLVLLEVEPTADPTGDADAAARPLAEVLRRTLREADTACRLSPTRFGLILEDTPEGGGVWAAERVRAGFARAGGRVELLSAGVAAYPSHALDATDLLARAERALERARAGGRGQVEVAPVD